MPTIYTLSMPTLQDVHDARSRVYRFLRPTALLQHALLTAESGTRTHNPTSAFKIRSGLMAAIKLRERLVGKKIVCVMSGGNIDQATLARIIASR